MQERSVLVNEVETILITDPTYIRVDPKWTAVDHDDVIKWKHFPHNRPFVRKIHRSPVNSPHKGQWRGALVFWYPCMHQELSKQWRRRWFVTPSRSFRRHCNALSTGRTWCELQSANVHLVDLFATPLVDTHKPILLCHIPDFSIRFIFKWLLSAINLKFKINNWLMCSRQWVYSIKVFMSMLG